jgi:radical SAM superfamily enzyme YgiQ (UPF0313 family)
MMKVVLINTYGEDKDVSRVSHLPFRIPVGPHYPLGITSIAAYLRKKLPNLSIKVFDEQIYSSADIKKELEKIRPDIVGLNCMFRNYKGILELAHHAKRSGARVLIGGNYASALAKEILNNRGPYSEDYCIDGVVRQDGEKAFYEYVAGKSPRKINNLVYREKEKIIENPIRLMNLNDLPSVNLNFEYLNPNDYFKEYRRRFPSSRYKRPFDIYSQKGCRWRDKPGGGCLFCSIMYNRLRLINPKIMWNEIDRLVFNYGVDYIWDVSDSFLSDKKWFEGFYRESLRRTKKPFFKIQARADELIDERIIRMLAAINTRQIFIGFESSDNKCLLRMGKGTAENINKSALSLLLKYKIPIRAYFLLGAPGETEKSLKKTRDLAEYILNAGEDNLVVTPYLIPLPGSSAFNLFIKKTGKKYAGKDIISWEEVVNDWAKYFCKVSPEEMEKVRTYLRKFPYDISDYSY